MLDKIQHITDRKGHVVVFKKAVLREDLTVMNICTSSSIVFKFIRKNLQELHGIRNALI